MADAEFDSLLVCNIIKLFFICLWGEGSETIFLYVTMVPKYWGALEQSKVLPLKTPLLVLGNDL